MGIHLRMSRTSEVLKKKTHYQKILKHWMIHDFCKIPYYTRQQKIAIARLRRARLFQTLVRDCALRAPPAQYNYGEIALCEAPLVTWITVIALCEARLESGRFVKDSRILSGIDKGFEVIFTNCSMIL